MKIEIVSISDSDKHFASAIAEYVKRLGSDVSLVDLKPVKHGSTEQIITAETQQFVDYLIKKPTATYLLSKEGTQFTTEQFADLLPKHNYHLRFIIGGPYGLDEQTLLSHVQGKVSFGLITMPHGLAKLVLIEQVYRIAQIASGRQYHY